MVREIIQIGDERLLQVSEQIPVEEIQSKATKRLADDLVDTYRANIDKGVGLSAVQIGEMKRIFVVKRIDLMQKEKEGTESEHNDEFEVMINPEVEAIDEKKSIEWEGCLSISSGDLRLFGPVFRPSKIRVEYYNLAGEKKSIEADGFFSHLIQHEKDHIDGVLFLKHVANPRNLWKEDELDKYLNEHGHFPHVV